MSQNMTPSTPEIKVKDLSEKRKQADLQQLEKRLAKKLAQAQAQLQQLSRQEFACEPDAQKATQRLIRFGS